MGRQELIESLRRRGDEQARALWSEAEAEAERIRAEARQTMERARLRARDQQLAATTEQERLARLEAERRARALHTEARRNLADRLHQAALAALPSLRDDNYGELFAQLASELPAGHWDVVRVNPADLPLVARYFPGARGEPEPEVTGGFIAESGDGSIRIDNTLEKRLERAWDDLLPVMLQELSARGGPR